MEGRPAARVMKTAMIATIPSAPAAARIGATAGGIGAARALATGTSRPAAPSVAAIIRREFPDEAGSDIPGFPDEGGAEICGVADYSLVFSSMRDPLTAP